MTSPSAIFRVLQFDKSVASMLSTPTEFAMPLVSFFWAENELRSSRSIMMTGPHGIQETKMTIAIVKGNFQSLGGQDYFKISLIISVICYGKCRLIHHIWILWRRKVSGITIFYDIPVIKPPLIRSRPENPDIRVDGFPSFQSIWWMMTLACRRIIYCSWAATS